MIPRQPHPVRVEAGRAGGAAGLGGHARGFGDDEAAAIGMSAVVRRAFGACGTSPGRGAHIRANGTKTTRRGGGTAPKHKV